MTKNYQMRTSITSAELRLALPETVSVAMSEIAENVHEGLLALAVGAGLLATRKVGRSNLLTPNPNNRLVAPLTEIALATMGPHHLIRDAFAHIDGVTHLLIYGSWAARYRGESGPAPNDLDVLVVGTPNRTQVYEAAEAVERRTGLPVNPVIASTTRWADDRDPLMTQIRSSPTVELELTDFPVSA